jgi:inosine-uridine nucleoside N-ribohydrolase
MIQQVRKYPGQVSIYSAGALTNIALAIRMDPDFAKNAKELIIMVRCSYTPRDQLVF